MNKPEILKEIITDRRSRFPREYTQEPIEKEVLDEILSSASFAPNHKRTKPWRLRLFQGEEKNALGEKLAEIYKEITPPERFLEKKYLDIALKWKQSQAVATIVVSYSGMVPEWEEIAAVAMGVQNMYLTASVHGVGCYWSSPALKDHLTEELELKENQKCLGFFFMGKVEN